MSALVIIIFLLIPASLTLINFFYLITGVGLSEGGSKHLDLWIFLLGIPLTFMLYFFMGFQNWDHQFYTGQIGIFNGYYEPIFQESHLTNVVLHLVAFLGYLFLRVRKEKLPPLFAFICYSASFLGIILNVFFIAQILGGIKHYLFLYLILLPLNNFMCTVRVLRELTFIYADKFKENNYRSVFLQKCCTLLSKTSNFVILSFLFVIPLVFILTCILLLLGQRPDEAVRMFTETAEWTFSQKTPPPVLPGGDQHYLCTVAAFGDEKKVKPIRQGLRCGVVIRVNRQLLVANAFEDLIREKTPKFHKIVRYVYDKYGYPLSKLITTTNRANFTYYIMKPLEWIFVVALYLFDLYPENRISVQYTGSNWRNNKIV